MNKYDNELFNRFYKSWHGIEVSYDKIAAECGLTTHVMYILSLMYKFDAPISQKQICAELHMSKQTLSSVVDGLEKRKLVIRCTNKQDRRIKDLVLTEKGKEVGKLAGRKMRCIERQAMDILSKEEQNKLVDALESLCKSFATILENSK